MLTPSKSILVVSFAALALNAAALTATAAELPTTRVVKPGHAAMLELGTKKVAATYITSGNLCDVVVSVASLPDADGNVSGGLTRITTPVAGGTQARVFVSDGYAIEASCALSGKLLTVRPIAFTAAIQ